MSAGLVVGVDVGGTYTDVLALDPATGECRVAKVPTTRPDPADGVRAGIERAIGAVAAAGSIVHGTTIGTNALLERRGAPTGVITTEGFRDVLEMRRRDRPHTWGLWGTFEPVVPRDRRLEVAERTLADGTVERPVDLEGVREAAQRLLAAGAEAVALVFVNAYANPENERRAAEALRAAWPNAFVSVSHEILPEIREFERTSTATLNAYLQPVVARYLERLEGDLRERGFAEDLLIVQSNGGVMAVETARRLPVRTALSGPAAGVIAARAIGRAAGYRDLVTCDMGGTSFDVSLVADGESVLSPQTSVDFGLTVRTPMIEMTTIGAGGGSIAWVDRGGLLQVGPDSAGSDPGPACYGRGNERPTVTDANVVLGRIDPERPIGGGAGGGGIARLDAGAARAALERHVAAPLGLDVLAAAEAVIRVANSRMAGAIRLVSIERGHDPRRFAAVAFGGGGALHAGALLREVGLARAIVPRFPGVTSALGCAIADLRHDAVETVNVALDDLDERALEARMAAAARAGRERIERAGAGTGPAEALFELDMLYQGQTHTIDVPLPVGAREEGRIGVTRAIVRRAFEDRYRRLYGRLLEGLAVRVLNLRTAVIGRRPALDPAALAAGAPAGGEAALARTGERALWLEGAWRPVPVHDRLALPLGSRVEGPAVLEQPDTTVWIDPGLAGTVDGLGNVVVERVG